jgi:hypothetical protein
MILVSRIFLTAFTDRIALPEPNTTIQGFLPSTLFSQYEGEKSGRTFYDPAALHFVSSATFNLIEAAVNAQ